MADIFMLEALIMVSEIACTLFMVGFRVLMRICEVIFRVLLEAFLFLQKVKINFRKLYYRNFVKKFSTCTQFVIIALASGSLIYFNVSSKLQYSVTANCSFRPLSSIPGMSLLA